MKFLCDKCEAKYQIPDEKVAGRTLRMACRKCGTDILIRGPGVNPTMPPPAAAATAVPQPAGPSATATVPRPAAAKSVTPPPPAVTAAARASQAPPAPPPAADEWHVAVNDVPVGPIQRDEIARKIGTGAVTGDSLAWREGFDDWRPLREIPQLASLLEQRRRPSVPPPRVAPPAPAPAVSASLAGRTGAARPRPGPVGLHAPERLSVPSTSLSSRVTGSSGSAASLASVALASPQPAASVPAPASVPASVPAPAAEPDDDFELDFASPSTPPPALTPAPLGVTAPVPGAPAPSLDAPPALAAAPPVSAPAERATPVPSARASEPSYEREVVHHKTPPWVWVMLVAGIFFGIVLGMKGSEWFGAREPAVAAAPSQPETTPSPSSVARELEIPEAPAPEGSVDAGLGAEAEGTDGSDARPSGSSSRTPTGATTASAGAGTMAPAAATDDDDVDFAQFESPTGMSVAPTDVTRSASSAVAPPLDQAAVQRVVSNNRRQLQTCYERAARGQANPPRARMDVNVTVGRSGTVTAVSATGNDFGGLSTCIEQSVRRWRFPASSDGGTTRFPVVFSPGG